MTVDHRFLRRWWNIYNKKYYGGKLPPVTIRYEHVDKHCALIEYYGDNLDEILVRVDTLYSIDGNAAKLHILHEMQHLHTGQMTHGKKFYADQDRVYELGAYRGLL